VIYPDCRVVAEGGVCEPRRRLQPPRFPHVFERGSPFNVSTVDILKIEIPENPSINSPELENPRAPAAVHCRHGGGLLVARTVRGDETAILPNGTPGCR
jgi:hypothetical protein